ncbi:MAG: hypothetical protein IJ761_04555 [Bacteroidales bacterium]|nr:hypothetical protein [Bacteroidales bacterium]
MKKGNAIVLILVMMLAACTNDADFVAPAFLHVEDINVVGNTISTDTGFYTSDISGAYVVAHFNGKMNEDTIGMFELPFTVPVLYSGATDYIDIYPAVRMSGITATQPYYSFYTSKRISGVTLSSTDTTDLGHLSVDYAIGLDGVLVFEPFEPTEASTMFDSVMTWERYAPAEARSGVGYGRLHVNASQSTRATFIEQDIIVTDPSSTVYIEFDIKSDIRVQIEMTSQQYEGANSETLSVMVCYPTSQWQHMYVNLGRTWRDFNHNPSFRVSFNALNVDNIDGDVRLDNVKIIKRS